MQLIPLLSNGDIVGHAIVDDFTASWASRFTWMLHRTPAGHRYAVKWKNAEKIADLMHRLILSVLEGRPLKRGEVTDHIDGNGLNNRVENLRLCTHSQNMCNRKSAKGSSSRFLGVHFEAGAQRWRAKCQHNGKTYRQWCDSEIEAARAYDRMAKELHGEFARPNLGAAQ